MVSARPLAMRVIVSPAEIQSHADIIRAPAPPACASCHLIAVHFPRKASGARGVQSLVKPGIAHPSLGSDSTFDLKLPAWVSQVRTRI